MFKRLFLIFLFFISFYPLFSQDIDSLKNLLQNTQDINKRRSIYLSLARIDTSMSSDDYFKKILKEAKNQNDSIYIRSLVDVGLAYKDMGEIDSALKYINEAITISHQKKITSNLDLIFYELAFIYVRYNHYSDAITYFDSATVIGEAQKDSALLAKIYNGAGSAYYRMGNYELALTNYQKALEIAEKLNISDGLPSLYANIALIHEKQQDYDLALKYFRESYELTRQLKIKNAYAPTAINLAHIFNIKAEYDSAKKYIKIALDIIEKNNNKYLLLHSLNILGDIYKNTDSLQLAIEQYNQALELAKMMNVKDVAASANLDLSEVYIKLADSLNKTSYLQKALTYAKSALSIAEQLKALPKENRSYSILADIYSRMNDYKTAFEYSQKYIETSKELFNQEKTKAIEEMQTKYQTEKQKQQIIQQQLELEKKDAIVKKQKTIQWAMAVGGLLLLFILILIYTGYRRKKRDNQLIQKQNAQLQQANEEIKVQRDILQEQKNKIEEIHKQLTDSINYAERIQIAAMPSIESLNKFFDNKFFLIYKPLHIVSGDFYWAKEIRGYIIFSVADCTGHGVPGAFVSMLGIAMLNEITQRREIDNPNEVLEIMRKTIKEALKQSVDWRDSKDGMDMVLCAYNKETKELKYSGANNPLIHIKSNGELIKYKPVRNPVGIYFKERPFETITFKVEKDDMIYLFSDGIVDQFGGEDNKKYTIKRFKDLLIDIHSQPCEEQKIRIENEINNWKGEYRQTDDITILAIRF